MKFKDRVDAGKQLAYALKKYSNVPDTVILGLARGGIVVAYEVAKTLQLPLDIKIVRKIGSPSNAELAIGALTASGTIYLNKPMMESMGLSVDMIIPIIEQEKKEALRRLAVYREDRAAIEIKDKTVIIVDDGIATGATMRAAIEAVKLHGVKKIIVAVPVADHQELGQLKNLAHSVVCLYEVHNLHSIGQYYADFSQVSDDQVVDIIQHV